MMTECTSLQFVSPFAFEAMQKVDVVRLASLSDPELRLLLPCLVRMALCAPADQSQSWAQDKKLILRLLSGVEAVNSIVALLSVDFHALEQDASKEQQLRHKLGGGSGESILVSQLQHGLTLEFEHSDSPRRLRLVLSELLAIMNKVEECHLPGLGVALTLDHTKTETCEDGVSDLVCFVSGLLLGTNAKVRTWFGTFIRNGQQRKRETSGSVLWQMRRQLLLELMGILPTVRSTRIVEEADVEMEPTVSVYSGLKEEHVVKASALLRLYCALMGIAGLKPTEEEAEQLLQLMTSRPPATPAGVRFVSLSFCMLLAFSTLVSTPEQEQLMVVWLSWMIKEEAYFESTSGVSASFGEMLLLVAMYFHSNQLSAIIDLVCSTLGMKVVTAHAVRVPVTSNLSANITGFLPIHCIYQLLRSRSFTKHKVSIKGDSVRLNQRFSITAQLLVLYYILSYEEALLANTKTLASMQRKPKSYSSSLMDQIPIKFLIRQAQGLQQELGGLHSALLRLLATNYPHLCIVDDWICEEEITGTDALLRRMLLTSNAKNHSPKQLQEVSHTQVMQIMEHLTLLSASELIPYAEVLTSNMNQLLNSGVPRRILQTVNKLWMVLNTVMPRRCPPLMDITLHMLNGYLLASKAYLSAHLKETAEQDRPSQNNTVGLLGQTDAPEVTREELKNALLAAQDSAAVQILLEICLPTDEEKAKGANPDISLRNTQSVITTNTPNKEMEEGEDNLLCNLREVQCLICCLLHQMYIADPNIAKLVHFQIFAIQLLSHLCIQYALPKSLSVARLAVNVMGTLLTGLQQIKEKPSGWSQICKDPSYKNGSRDTGSMDPDVQLCHCIESTIIEIINMSVSGI
ncbi:Integrator complex subunit 2 [Cricetulus griseus]|uniref:Integrator complex subunit 2 n=1 Tax=Cricetulus griseus TaxID=10029 RepID=G3I6L8_CRIGR|nr:Integrator complex subunit 2 [Cricetulus griseus]ERE68080.1 integrator complex subunit 2 [Cricetulus griseus]